MTSSQPNFNLAWPFFRSAENCPGAVCVFTEQREFTYTEFMRTVRQVADWLTDSGATRPSYIGILASRSWEACAGVLAAAWAGAAYVPINLKLPPDALIALLNRIDLDAIIADSSGLEKLKGNVISHLPRKVLTPGHKRDGAWIGFADLDKECNFEPRQVAAERPAYVEFTSGSTGSPKGVMIPNGAVFHFLRVMQERYEIRPEDRIAETAETTFDISVFNMFMAWRSAASLHIIPRTQAMAPAKFLQEHGITVWFSVPSVAAAMLRMGLLGPGTFPSLRVSLFSGEPLPAKIAAAWKQAAPHSVVDNLYGPTEATVICLYQRVEKNPKLTRERDIIAIGRPLPGTACCVWDHSRRSVPAGVHGELVLAGPQLALGYLSDPEKTAARFVEQAGKRWYLTGDLAYQDHEGFFHHLGRMDNQVKVRGYRVELEEIETHLRDAYGTASAAAVAWPMEYGSASGIVGFVSDPRRTGEEASQRLRLQLPRFMVPARVHVLPELPNNSSGKIDRRALARKLEEGEF